jgi:hypothetical protein
MDGIQQVGFSPAVIAANTNDAFAELKGTLAVIFKPGE